MVGNRSSSSYAGMIMDNIGGDDDDDGDDDDNDGDDRTVEEPLDVVDGMSRT